MGQKKKWYLDTWFIVLMCAAWILIVPAIIGIILLIIKSVDEKKKDKECNQIKHQNEQFSMEISQMNGEINRMKSIGVNDVLQANEKLEQIKLESEEKIRQTDKEIAEKIDRTDREISDRVNKANKEVSENIETLNKLREEISVLQAKGDKLNKSVTTQERKISRAKELYNSVEHAIDNFFNKELDFSDCLISEKDINDMELISPSVILKLHCMDMKSLRKAFRENEKLIDKTRQQYAARYTTKANKTIYDLIVKGLESEMQNVLYNLKYDKLDSAVEQIKDICAKYMKIAAEGSQTIAGTITKFIGEMEYLFINAAKIEYNYYVKKEQAKQEQIAIKEQMRQEAEERKALDVERKKVEMEESKYENQITSLKQQVESSKGEELAALQARILELQAQLSDVTVKKAEITKLQNGKAGNVYIISNLGSFGEHVFKIGMTRRLNPQDRVNELGDASVPFKFDVHSFIFSDDASGLETQLHKRLDDRRVNKVNLRKEFFDVTIDELEKLVNEICPTAEFTRTMLAEEYRQSLSCSESYTSDYVVDETEDDIE